VRAAVLLCSVVLLAACGGDAVSLDPVAEAAATTSKTGSEHVRFTGTSEGGGQVIRITGSGDFQNDPQLGRMTLEFGAGATTGTIREVMHGWRIYMTSPLFAGQLPQGSKWLTVDLAQAGRSAGIDFSQFASQTPGQTLRQLRASGQVKKVGTETVDGVETTEYTSVLDPAKIPQSAKVQRLANAKYEPVHVWVDGEGRVRRIRTAFTALGSANEMTMTFSEFGKDVHVSLPPAAETYDATGQAASTLQNGGG
jgi:LppX/LprAFG-like lipoprotein